MAIALEVTGGPDLAIFLTSAAAILPLAGLIGRSTEQLALHTGAYVIMAISFFFVEHL